jgi:sarcosine oxidase
MNKFYDTIIIGLGGMGSAAVYQLAGRGQRVLGLERFTPAHNQGSSHGKSRVIRQAYFEDPAYVPLLLRAYELWRQIEQESGKQLLTITGGLMIGDERSQTFSGSVRSAREWNLPHEVLGPDDVRRRFPQFVVPDDVVAFYETQAGFVHPEDSVWAHLQQALLRGADLHFSEPVTGWEASDGGVRVMTERGVYEAEKLVIAPGAWAPQLMADLALPFVVTRQTLYWFEPIGGAEPFAVGKFPIFIWELPNGDQFYGFPAQPGVYGVKVAFFYKGPGCNPDAVNRLVSDEEVATIRAAFAPHLPNLNGPLINAATCLYTEVPDHHFIVALHPQHPNVVLASPCSGHGYKFCSAIGEVLADLAVDGETRHSIARFDPARFGNDEVTR